MRVSTTLSTILICFFVFYNFRKPPDLLEREGLNHSNHRKPFKTNAKNRRKKIVTFSPIFSKSFLIFLILKSLVLTIASTDTSRSNIFDQKVIDQQGDRQLFNLDLGNIKFSQDDSHLIGFGEELGSNDWFKNDTHPQKGLRKKRFVRFPAMNAIATGRGPSPKLHGRPFYTLPTGMITFFSNFRGSRHNMPTYPF